MIAAGQAKSLKTSMILDLMVSLITKKKFLGNFPVVKQSNVILMSGESGLDSLQNTTLRICASKGITDRDLWDHLFCCEILPRFGNVDHLNGLDRMLQETGSKVLVIDPIYLCMAGTDAGNLFAQGELLAGITEIGRKHDATLVLLHHTRKQSKAKKLEAAAPAELEDMAWAGFTEWARQWILVNRRSPYVPGDLHRLWLTIGGSAGHASRWAADIDENYVDGQLTGWRVKLQTAEEADDEREQSKEDARREKILQVLRNCPEGESKTALFERAGVGKGTPANDTLDELVDEGVIVSCSIVKNKRSMVAFRLADKADVE
jgi:hypothetical protein